MFYFAHIEFEHPVIFFTAFIQKKSFGLSTSWFFLRTFMLALIQNTYSRVLIKRTCLFERFRNHCSFLLTIKIQLYDWMSYKSLLEIVQVNRCQKLFFLQNMGRTCCVQKLFWMPETISVHNTCSSQVWARNFHELNL